jgi:flagellar hook-associated protein 1 FlgK
MPSPFMGIDIAARALRSFQSALDVTGHNIANVNTTGYSRETVNFNQTEATTFYFGKPIALGTGVEIASVNRIRDMFLQGSRLATQSQASQLATLSTNLSNVENIVLEPGTDGISDALNSFFDAWSALASNPTESAARFQVQQAGQTLADRIKNTYAGLSDIKNQCVSDVENTFNSIDQLTTKIADYNKEIRKQTAQGVEPNDLLDLRDQAIQDLSGLINVTTQTFDDGSVAVYVGQCNLVDSSGSKAIPRTYDATAQTISSGQFTYKVSGGQLNGLFQSITTVNSYQTQLDNFANTLRTQVNTLHKTGTNNLDPATTGINFFNDSTPQTGASDLDLSTEVKANADAISSSITGNDGDGGLALSLSQLRDSSIAGLGSKTMSEYYADFASGIGSDVDYYKSALEAKNAVLTQIDTQVQSVSGVSLDDEMASMLRFQRSYQAAAKMLNIFDQVTEDLINLIRT